MSGADVSAVLTEQQRAVLHDVVAALRAAGVEFQVTGGLAGNVHGSRWPLHDIDLDVRGADLPRVAVLFGPFVVFDGRYEDDEFRLDLVRLRVGEVEVDVSGVENAWVKTKGGWRPLVTRLEHAEEREFAGLRLPTIPLADLVAYKTLLGRAADVADLTRRRPGTLAP